ncbi:hypothetical protein BH24DEI2_BH24DEI2_13640 [soil metagenome]
MSEPVTVTYLELLSPSAHKTKTNADPRFGVSELAGPTPTFNKRMYTEVGRAWQWTERLAWSDTAWLEYASSPKVHTFAARYDGTTAGYFELREADDEVELVYFGLLPDFVGKKIGGSLLSVAIQAAWALNPRRVWVHTCTLDHPAALANYQARGFRVYKTVTES